MSHKLDELTERAVIVGYTKAQKLLWVDHVEPVDIKVFPKKKNKTCPSNKRWMNVGGCKFPDGSAERLTEGNGLRLYDQRRFAEYCRAARTEVNFSCKFCVSGA